MNQLNRKAHWENIYRTKPFENVSWYQKYPKTSLAFLKENKIGKSAKIIDVGGGDSYFVDYLLELGYKDITVIDISRAAINRAIKRLGEKAYLVKWKVADAASFPAEEQYDFWHDRAAFHFLTDEEDIQSYLETVQKSLKPNSVLAMGTFSVKGPTKCSGIEVKQYSKASMTNLFKPHFKKIRCFEEDHQTPFDSVQKFVFCSFKRLSK